MCVYHNSGPIKSSVYLRNEQRGLGQDKGKGRWAAVELFVVNYYTFFCIENDLGLELDAFQPEPLYERVKRSWGELRLTVGIRGGQCYRLENLLFAEAA